MRNFSLVTGRLSLVASLQPLIHLALAEDLGAGDVTSALLIPADAQATMRLRARGALTVAGVEAAAAVFHAVDAALEITVNLPDAHAATAGDTLLAVRGNARALLAAERTALNLLQHACGVATLTRRFVDAVAGTKAVILDTRKTLPGLRALDKHAVACGGGQNHRFGLYDAVLVKDNHLALGIGHWALGMEEAVSGIRKNLPSLMPNAQCPMPIIIECDTPEQVREALRAKPDRILLDNMDIPALQAAVRLSAGAVKLEASGGVTLGTVRAIAETGVDYISIGALTHSAPAADIGADVE